MREGAVLQTHPSLTDRSDAEWARLEPLFPAARTGRRRHHPVRTCGNALLYLRRTGGAWRWLPPDGPPWQRVSSSLRKGRRDGTLERLHTLLREAVRGGWGRDPQPSAGSVESQSVKTSSVGGERGDDGAKPLVGRKRHLLVESDGFLLAVTVHPTNSMDRDGSKRVRDAPTRARLPRRRHLWLDTGDNGRGKRGDWGETVAGWTVPVLHATHRFTRSWVPNDLPTDQIDWSQ